MLLDGNVLVALCDSAHVHHDAAEGWFAALNAPFITCPITQGILLRLATFDKGLAGLHGDVVELIDG